MLLHAIDTGTGPGTVLLLHGMMGSSESWWRLIPPLAANGHRVIALDPVSYTHLTLPTICSV